MERNNLLEQLKKEILKDMPKSKLLKVADDNGVLSVYDSTTPEVKIPVSQYTQLSNSVLKDGDEVYATTIGNDKILLASTTEYQTEINLPINPDTHQHKHQDLSEIQGGITNEYYHLTAKEHEDLIFLLENGYNPNPAQNEIIINKSNITYLSTDTTIDIQLPYTGDDNETASAISSIYLNDILINNVNGIFDRINKIITFSFSDLQNNSSFNYNFIITDNIDTITGDTTGSGTISTTFNRLNIISQGLTSYTNTGFVYDSTYSGDNDNDSYGNLLIYNSNDVLVSTVELINDKVNKKFSASYNSLIDNSDYTLVIEYNDGDGFLSNSVFTINLHTLSANASIKFNSTFYGYCKMYVYTNTVPSQLIGYAEYGSDTSYVDVPQRTFDVASGYSYQLTAEWYDANLYNEDNGTYGTGGIDIHPTGTLSVGQTYLFNY